MYDNSVVLRLDNLGQVDEKSLREDQLVFLAGIFLFIFHDEEIISCWFQTHQIIVDQTLFLAGRER